jgi:hypothetical protein
MFAELSFTFQNRIYDRIRLIRFHEYQNLFINMLSIIIIFIYFCVIPKSPIPQYNLQSKYNNYKILFKIDKMKCLLLILLIISISTRRHHKLKTALKSTHKHKKAPIDTQYGQVQVHV